MFTDMTPENPTEYFSYETETPKSKKLREVEIILSQSDIVWGRYGTDTIEKLAQRIISSLQD